MPVTQIVSAWSSGPGLQDSLGRLKTEKVVFFTPPEQLRDALEARNEFAIKNRIPTEVKILEKDVGRLCEALAGYKEPVLHLIDHNPLNYYLLSASMILGFRVYMSNGFGMEEIMTVPVRLSEFLNDMQLQLMKFLDERPLTAAEAAKKLNTKPGILSFYIHGNNSIKGLIMLGVVEEKDGKFWLTEFGKSVVGR